MRQLAPAAIAALKGRNVTIRDFLWIEARERTTGVAIPVGFWSDLSTVSAQVIDPHTGGVTLRSFQGAGGLIEISQVTMTSSLSVQSVNVTMSQISNASDLVRAYNVKQARIEVFRGLFAPATLIQLAPAFPRFVGFVDSIEIKTPAEGGDGGIELTCVSHSQEMSRSNPATRSDADQQIRRNGDTFSRHAAAVGTWEMQWGADP
ncbi:hypothetical protein [Oceaniovalibus sp. ACAM 378]|uniref:hypothetical protein n=1 Tax=Oceaniovalibus sp. ACAM 378 TaxID=2599923 RepID=UPI0011D84515|nr:hypothetical protein [Oceaniovalibus sp. ACAM 378]TYB83973.1 hypothetical protein FQ320_23425 [Oceaniovalibus sp. ACAM 378]